MERPRSWVEIDLGRIKSNYAAAMSGLGAASEAIAVVKSNAYGHGDVEVARALYECGVRRFAVANIDEAVRLREAMRGFKSANLPAWSAELRSSVSDVARRGSPLPVQSADLQMHGDERECEVLILGYTPPQLAPQLAEYGLTQALISAEYAEELASREVEIRSHLAIDSGMKRLGISADDPDRAELTASRYGKALGISAVFTHLSCADSDTKEDIAFTERQIQSFLQVYDRLRAHGVRELHCLNSAGILYHADRLPQRLKALVRPGIILYGLSPRSGGALPGGILPSLSWKTVIASIRHVRAGESIGYGRSFIAGRDMDIATVPVGYADGYPRSLSGLGYAMIAGRRATVTGRICMNQFMLDVTDIGGLAPGDAVTLIGEGADAGLISELSGSISYELVSRIPACVPRIYKED